ncbi:MAG: folate-binding protein YgfZ [Paracoccaceae bacterium]|jgi:folate-binding protein YgfZ
MTSFWTQLEEHCATRYEGEHCNFDHSSSSKGIPEAETSVAPLSHYGFLRVKGADAHTFLQGQTSADFRQVSTSEAQRGAYCTPKGRMLTSFLAAGSADNDVLLRMRGNLVESSKAVLAKYAVFSKAELSDASTEFIGLGIAGEQAAALVSQQFGSSPATYNAVVSSELGLAIQIDSLGQRYELWLHADQAFACWQHLLTQAKATGSLSWDELAINDGIADVCAATVGDLIPQMLNYDATGTVNFKKGCYTGQEVVARLHYRGTAKRRLYRGTVQSGHVVEGDEVFADDKAQASGLIANTANGKALIVLARDALSATKLHTTSGAILGDIQPPPYDLKD